MRAHTTTTSKSRHGRMARRAVLGITVCALGIPAIAGAQPIDSDPVDTGYSSVNAISGASSEPSQPVGGSEYSSLNAISGSPAEAPTFASGPPSASDDGFDWASALVGAGAGLALAALGAAALLTVRRRSTIATSPSTS